VEDKVSGLDLGANDYITKPFQIEELLARIRAALRIKSAGTEEPAVHDCLEVSDLKLNEKTREVSRGDQAIELTPREFDLLVYLMTNKRQVLNREQILEAVWGYDFLGDTNVVDVYIRYLRKKIDMPERPALIHTIRGVGYVLKETK
jgi:DNA-binding response OmpR family regulator